ncbi:MAG: tRNA dihydrouridine synthase DusB [Candidatus Latescibacteria bacterium]|jgi:tRNA-dihydrouridine synthase B|nr:tRNA dihydrouridine synthase DusB [Gemmatimonadaceae bacterium]MDP6014497.1 tRNA dihydrouridine synthase DusB [Candidatus Latescibacterota bacterium]MDP7450136.1 tRNA dihydrouridine synthase DusB [Candidatus Latescibacterota bacterium]HJP31427.1 tRNA dihydrouridine synthase DusB [Candidatus Latescibacterota bacterium]
MALDHPLRIGAISVHPGLLLAPMEDISEQPFRLVCRQLGADLVYTEFVNAEGLLREDPEGPRRTARKLDFSDGERPLGIQIYGASERSMEEAARRATERQPDLIDINCGCWVKNVALRGAGAGLLRDLPQMRQVVRRVRGATHLPVTVKTRLGWDAASIQIVEVARMLQDEGVQALAVHCRTRAQGHKGDVDYSWIPRIKAAVQIPVILNGDVVSPQTARSAFEETGCDGVMIGRAAIRHPWLFREIRHYLDTGSLLPEPCLRERAELCQHHLRLSVSHFGERYGMISMKRHYAGYFRGIRGVARLRAELSELGEIAQLETRLQQLAAAADDPQAVTDAPMSLSLRR